MGSVTEQEAREAVVKLRNALELASELNPDDHDESERDIKREVEKHETTLIRFAKQELSRREADRAVVPIAWKSLRIREALEKP